MQSPSPLFSENDLLELRAAFDVFDEGKTGMISVHSLKFLVRALGFQMTRGDVSRRVAQVLATTRNGGAASRRHRERQMDDDGSISTEGRDLRKTQRTGVRVLERANVQQLESDQDDDGGDDDDGVFVDFGILCEVVADKYAKRDPGKEIEKAFRIFDTTNTGRITVSDVRKIACDLGEGESLTEDELRALIDEFDKDGDGVTLDVFRGIMRKGRHT